MYLFCLYSIKARFESLFETALYDAQDIAEEERDGVVAHTFALAAVVSVCMHDAIKIHSKY